ncbi:C-type mannose receptor 2-like [Salarias fasciatus]|uniref:C-type mannose receptor 2-like n=1 Tax=Salarias fasciatus TaxID=181472 RepID=A0A672H5W4_SALFA|nr:C-type mannose receptor 2-like [Salarias fasciatus]
MMTVMKNSLLGLVRFLLCLLLSSSTVSGLGSVVSKSYPHIRNPKTWHAAQEYCRSKHTDLAILYQRSDGERMSLHKYYAWIGLSKLKTPTEWTLATSPPTSLIEWASNEPDSGDSCALISHSSNKVYGTNCEGQNFFHCYKNEPDSRTTFVPLAMTWQEAQKHCENNRGELISQFPIVTNYLKSEDFPVWIGLHREGGTWKWSSGSSAYRSWSSPPSDNHHYNDVDDDCVSISSLNKKMAAKKCTDQFPFVCVSDNLLLVKEKKSWEEAVEHCRAYTSPTNSQHRYDLASVQPGDDQNYIMTTVMKADTQEVWVGLRFLAGRWLWVTGADMLYADLPECPLEGNRCGALTKTSTTSVKTRDCTEKKNFLCYRK